MKKKNYAQPSCRFLVVRFKESLLTVSVRENIIQDATYDEWEDEL